MEGEIHRNILMELRRVHIHMDLLRVRRVVREAAGDPVIETHAEGEKQVRFLNGLVHPGLSVHPHHPETEGMASGHRAQTQQGRGVRDVLGFRQGEDFLPRAAHLDAVTGEDERAFGSFEHPQRRDEIRLAGKRNRAAQVARRRCGFPFEGGFGLLGVLRDVHEDRPRPSRAREREGLPQRGRDVLRLRHQVVVLGDGKRGAGDVHFLKGVCSEHGGTHLTRDRHERRAIEHGRGEACDEVRGARARSREHHAHLARGSRVAIRHVAPALLVAHEHMADGVIEEFVVGGQHRAAGIAEDQIHAFAH